MNFLVYDCETTGLPIWDRPSSHPGQPRICQLAALLTDEAGNKLGSMDTLIKPQGWTIDQDAFDRHGISMERCHLGGIRIGNALAMFMDLWEKAGVRVGHSESFDCRMVRIEMVRSDLWKDLADRWKDSKAVCTMNASRILVGAEATDKMKASGRNGPKPPTLSEAYQFFTGKPLGAGAHSAMVDVVACKTVFFELLKRGAIDPGAEKPAPAAKKASGKRPAPPPEPGEEEGGLFAES